MHIKRTTAFILLLFFTARISAQNRYIYVLHDRYDKVERIYLLDGRDLFNPYATYLISYLRSDSLQRIKYYSPLTATPEGPLGLNTAPNLNTKPIWKSDEGKIDLHTLSMLSDNVLLYKNRNGIFHYLPFRGGSGKTPEKLLPDDSTMHDASEKSVVIYTAVSVTASGERGFVIDHGKISTFAIKDDTPAPPSVLEKIQGQVNSIHTIGNSKLLYIHENILSCAEFRNDTVLHLFNFKIKGEDKLKNSVIENIQLNPADPAIAAVVAKGIKGEKEVSYLAIGHLNFSRRTITLETIRPQSFKAEKIILSCNWSPDGRRLAVLTSIKSKIEHDGCGQLIIMAYDVLNRQIEKNRFFKPYDHFVKVNSGIAWSPDGAYLFYVKKDTKGDYLAFVDNKMKRSHAWELVDENKKPFTSISGITGPICVSNGDSTSMVFYIAGTIGKSTAICKTADFLPVMKPTPFDKQLPGDLFNNALSTADEVLEFEKLIKKRKLPAKEGGINIAQNLKSLQVPLNSDVLKKAFKHYCLNRIDKLAPKRPTYNYHTMTLTDLYSSQQMEQTSSNLQKKELDAFIIKRKAYIKDMVRFERLINDLKGIPAASSVLLDSLINILTIEAADSIRNGSDLSPVFVRIMQVRKNLDRLYTHHALFDEYRNSYKKINGIIEQIILSSSGLNSNAIRYLTYLSVWDSTQTVMDALIRKRMLDYSITATKDSGTVNAQSLDTALQEYIAFGLPRYFKPVNRRFHKKGTDGLNHYFTFNKKAFLITTGSGVFCAGLGFLLNLAAYDNLNSYHDEKSTVDAMLRYKEKTEREYAWSTIFYGVGGGALGFSAYYLINYILKKRTCKTEFTYDPKTASLVWRF